MDVPTNAGTRGPAPANPGVIAAEAELTDPVNPLRDPRDRRIPAGRRPVRHGDVRRHRRPGPQEADARPVRPGQPRPAAAGLLAGRLRPPGLGATRTSRRSPTSRSRSTRARRSARRSGSSCRRASASCHGEFTDDAAFDQLADSVRQLDVERGTGGNYAFYLSIPPKFFPTVVRAAQAVRAVRPRPGRRRRARAVAAGGHREAVRPRPGDGAGAERDRRRGLPGRVGVPHRPLPGQGDGPEHPGAALRQHPVRADLEPRLTSTTCRSPCRRTSGSAAGPATTTASARPATSSRTTCCSCWR